jgi:hypothetical protein
MYLKKLYLIIIVGLLVPVGAVAQLEDALSSGDQFRSYVNERCRAGDAGVKAANSMFTIATRVSINDARQYCDCFASEMTAIVEERALDWGTRDKYLYRNGPFDNRVDKPCFQPFDDGQRKISPRQMPYDERQAILEAIATP